MVLEHLQRQDSIITFPGTYVKSPLEIKKRGSMHCTMNLSLPEHTGLRASPFGNWKSGYAPGNSDRRGDLLETFVPA